MGWVEALILAAPVILKGADLLFDISGEQAADVRAEKREEQRLALTAEEVENRERNRSFDRLVSLTDLGSNVLKTQTGAARLNALRNSGNTGNL